MLGERWSWELLRSAGLDAWAVVRDEDFAELYCADNGRESVPPRLLATVLLLQTHDRASDAEAKQKADFDIRWKVALGIEERLTV